MFCFVFWCDSDLVPYMMIHEELQAPLNCSQSTTWSHHETDIKKEEEKVKPEKKIATVEPASDTRCQQRDNSPEHSTSGKSPLDFGLVNNGMDTKTLFPSVTLSCINGFHSVMYIFTLLIQNQNNTM